MQVQASERKQGLLGVCGHVGVGHAHSNAGFVQDDSAGFAVTAALLRMAYPVDTRVADVVADPQTDTFTVVTSGGGQGQAWTRRGVTPHEKRLVHTALGQEALFTQPLTCKVFGRVYGQGAMEQAAAFQAATALAVVDTFAVHHAERMQFADEDLPGQIGRMMGGVVEMEGVPLSVMAVINATRGGLGPVEDLEGIINLGAKGRLMHSLGLDAIPLITVEGKQFVPGVSDDLPDPEMWVRANAENDNLVVAECLYQAAQQSGIACGLTTQAYPRRTGDLTKTTKAAGERVAELGQRLAVAETSREKVAVAAELAEYISQEVGAVSFMTNAMHDLVAGGGLMSGHSAMLSLLDTLPSIRYWKIPCLTESDLQKYLQIIAEAIPLLIERYDQSMNELHAKKNSDVSKMQWLFD